MSKALIERLRRSREIRVPVGGKTYTVRRPTDIEALEIHRSGESFSSLAQRFVSGWELCELDIIPGGGPEPVPFDAELWADWVADQPDLWQPLAMAMLDAYQEHASTRTGNEKN